MSNSKKLPLLRRPVVIFLVRPQSLVRSYSRGIASAISRATIWAVASGETAVARGRLRVTGRLRECRATGGDRQDRDKK